MPEMNDGRVYTRTMDLHVRNLDEETGIIEGYASRWNEADAYGDVIEPGAFAETISRHRSAGTMPAMLWLHREPAGVWEVIEERSDGLFVRGRFALDTSTGREAFAHAKAKTTTGLSIGFQYLDFEIDSTGIWRVKAVDLHEISLTPIPAAPRARITNVRQIGAPMPEQIQTPEAPANPAPAPEQRSAPTTDNAAMESRFTDLETRMNARLDDIEVRSQRVPASPRGENEQRDIEMRALATFARTGDDSEIRAAATDNNPDGGWLVLPTVDTAIRDVIRDMSPLRSLAEVVSISTDKYERFYSIGKRGAQRVTEREDRPQDTARPELKKHSYGVGEYYAAPTATRHQLDDSVTDVASWLINNATQDFAETEGEDFLSYNGTDGFPRGLLDYGTTNEKDFIRAWGVHQYIPAGHASAPTDANLVTAGIGIVAALRKPYKPNARWLMNSTTATRLQAIVDANGRRLWAPTGNLIEGVEHPLLGYPVEIDENMPDIAAGEHPIAFGDFRQGYVIVDRHGVRINRDELTQKGRVVFDVYKRTGGGAGDFNAIKFIKVAAS